MRQVFAGWGVAAKRKVEFLTRSYDILSAPVATDEYISCVEESGFISSLDIIYFVTCFSHIIMEVYFLCSFFPKTPSPFAISLTISGRFRVSASAVCSWPLTWHFPFSI